MRGRTITPKLRVGIDLDGVVFNFTHGWTTAYAEQFGGDLIRPEQIVEWDCWKLTHFDSASAWFRWIERDHTRLFRNLRPYPGAIRMVQQVSDVAHAVIITAKPAWARACTFAALSRYELPVDEVHLTMDKAKVPCDIYLDDSPSVIRALAAGQPDAMVCRWVQPWNRPVDGVHDFDDFDDFVAQVDTLI